MLVGFVAGVLSGLFGVGGGIVMTPGLTAFAGVAPIVAVATPLPVILPTAMVGAFTYHRAGEVDVRAAVSISLTGAGASAVGALLTRVVNARLLLVATAALLAWQSVEILRGRSRGPTVEEATHPRLGPGARRCRRRTAVGAPGDRRRLGDRAGARGGARHAPEAGARNVARRRRRAGDPRNDRPCGARPHRLAGRAVPGDRIAPGARIGAKIALGTKERTLRLLVGSFLGVVAVVLRRAAGRRADARRRRLRPSCYTSARPRPGRAVPSSSGLGHYPLKVETRVRTPLGLPQSRHQSDLARSVGAYRSVTKSE